MARKSKTVALWDHQNESLDFLLERPVLEGGWDAIVLPTGAGKSNVLTVVASLLAEQPEVKGVILCTPHTHIVDQMCVAGLYTYTPADGQPTRCEITEDLWRNASVEEREEAFTEHFKRVFDDSCLGTVYVVTHARLTWPEPATQQRAVNWMPVDMTGFVILVDEIHRAAQRATTHDCEANHISDFAMEGYRRGARIISASASSGRHDKRRVYPKDVRMLTIPYSELVSNYGFPTLKIDVRELTGSTPVDMLTDNNITQVCAYTKAMGRPATIRIPSGTSVVDAARVVDALVAAGFDRDRILNAVGPGSAVANALRAALVRERAIATDPKLGFHHRTLDVIVVCGRGGEALDWLFCCHVVDIGISQSCQNNAQYIGRGLRCKRAIKDFPVEWADQTLYTAFTPKWAEGVNEKERHVQRLLLVAASLEASDAYVDYQGYWVELVRGCRVPPKTFRRVTRLPQIDPALADDARELLLRISQMLLAAGVRPTIYRFFGILTSLHMDPRRWNLVLIALREILIRAAEQDAELREALRAGLGAILEAALKRLLNDDREAAQRVYVDLLYAHFVALGARYAHLVTEFRGFPTRRVEGILSGEAIKQIAVEMVNIRNHVFRWSDVYLAKHLLNPYLTEHGSWPTLTRGEQLAFLTLSDGTVSQVSLRQVDDHLKRTDFDLARLVASHQVHWVLGGPGTDYPSLNEVYRTHLMQTVPIYRGRARGARVHPGLWETSGQILVSATGREFDMTRMLGHRENRVAVTLGFRRNWRDYQGDLMSLDDLLASAEEKA